MGADNTVRGLEEILSELKRLREWKEEAQAWITDAQKGWQKSVAKVNDLQKKLAAIERRPHVLDPLDEEWLFRTQARLHFSVGLDGRRKLRLRGRTTKQIVRTGTAEQELLQEVINAASGRPRGRKRPVEKVPATNRP